MATPVDQLDALISMTFDNYKETLSDNVTKRTPLLRILDSKSNVTEDGGLTIVRPIMHGLNNTVKSYKDDDVLDITRQGGFGHAKYDWKQIAGSVVFTGRETDVINAGGSQIISLLKSKFNQFEVSYADAIQKMLWAEAVGNTGKDLTGLPVIVDDTGTLGGIDPTTEAFWKAKRAADTAGAPVDLTTTAGLKVLQSMYNSLYTVGSGVDVEVTTQANYEAYHDLSLDKLRFQNAKLADLGIPSLAHFGASVMFDSYMPAADAISEVGATAGGDWFFLNTDRLEFVKHSRVWLNRRAPQHPDDKDMTIVVVLSAGELITDSRRSHGRIKFTKVA